MKKQIVFFTTLSLFTLAGIAGEAFAKRSAGGEAQVRIELDQEVYPSDTASKAVVKIAVEAPPTVSTGRSPLNLSIVLDRSGSMRGDRIENARLAAIEAVRRLGPEDIFSLVTYDSVIETLIPAQRVRDIESIEAKIRAITPRGMTALYGGVNQGAAEIRKHLDGAYVHRILLLSDGIANVGPSSPADLERLGQALGRENIAVTTIGVGLDYNEDLMTRLAQASDGNTYFVEASQDLPRILGAELGDALNVFARQVIIRIQFADGVRPIAILGRDGDIRGRSVEIPLHQLYGGQERFALVEVELPKQSPGTEKALGRAEVVYENLATRRQVESRSDTTTVRFSADETEVTASANTAVQAQVLEIRAAYARDRAIELADQGKRKEAAAELRTVSSLYSDAANRFNAPAFGAPAQAMADEARQVEELGIDNRQRKSYRAANHQVVNQQSEQP